MIRQRKPMSRGKPLERSGYMRRGKRINPKRKTRRRSSRVRDTEHMLTVKTLACIVSFWKDEDCEGVIEANHASHDHGLGQKGSDRCTIPMCARHHRHWTDHTGVFKRFTKPQRRSYADFWIKMTQSTVAEILGRDVEPAPASHHREGASDGR